MQQYQENQEIDIEKTSVNNLHKHPESCSNLISPFRTYNFSRKPNLKINLSFSPIQLQNNKSLFRDLRPDMPSFPHKNTESNSFFHSGKNFMKMFDR